MEITTSTDNIKSFGGLNFISEEFNKLKLPELITKQLGKHSLQAKYSFSDIIKNLWAITFAGGDCAEDIHLNLKGELLQIDESEYNSRRQQNQIEAQQKIIEQLKVKNQNQKNNDDKQQKQIDMLLKKLEKLSKENHLKKKSSILFLQLAFFMPVYDLNFVSLIRKKKGKY